MPDRSSRMFLIVEFNDLAKIYSFESLVRTRLPEPQKSPTPQLATNHVGTYNKFSPFVSMSLDLFWALFSSNQPLSKGIWACRDLGSTDDARHAFEEFRNSHGGAPSAGVGTSYLCCSNCDERYSNCDGINRDAVTIARADQ